MDNGEAVSLRMALEVSDELPLEEEPIQWGDRLNPPREKRAVDMVSLEESYFAELERRLDKEPEKIPGSILPRLTDFFMEQREKRIAAEERQLALEAEAASDPLKVILLPGLPLARKNHILMEYIRDLRAELDQAEQALGGLNA